MNWLIRSAMADLYPATGRFPGVADTGIDAYIERFRRETSALMWVGLVLAAVVYALTPVITTGLPLPHFALPTKARDRHAEKISAHPVYLLRQSVFLLKLVAGMCWAESPQVRKLLSLEPYPADPGTWRSA